MILAAGQGTRVRPLTRDLPKPMVPILGKPVMEYPIEHLARFGVRQIMINVAFNHWKIESHFGDGRRWGAEIRYSFEGERQHGDIVPEPMGSAGGMKKIQDFSGFFDETTVVLCGDALFEHRNKGALASVVALNVPREDVGNYGIVKTDKIGRVSDYWNRAAACAVRRGGANGHAGPRGEARGVGRAQHPRAVGRVTIVGPVYIGSGVHIEPGVTIQGPAWIGSGSHVRRGASLVRSVLFEYTRIAEAQVFHELIVAPQYCVDRKGDTFYLGDEACPLRWGDARA